MNLGKRLRQLRRDRDWTQENVASHLKVTRSTYAYYESNKTMPDNETLIALSDLFDVTVDYLLRGDALPQEKPDEPPRKKTELDNDAFIRENEQRLVTAYRILSRWEKARLLETAEKLALDECSRRRKNSRGESV